MGQGLSQGPAPRPCCLVTARVRNLDVAGAEWAPREKGRFLCHFPQKQPPELLAPR